MTSAWQYRFNTVPWPEIAGRYQGLALAYPEFRHLADVVDSVLVCGGEPKLAGLTKMHDIVVTPKPVPDEPPIEVVIVRSPSSGLVAAGQVLIEHNTITGDDDRIVRPSVEAVPLFWQFMVEKFGVRPVRPGSAK